MAVIIHDDHFFRNVTITKTDFDKFPDFKFGWKSIGTVIAMLTRDAEIHYSFNGLRLDGILDCNMRSITLDNKAISRIWFKIVGTPTSGEIRLSAWPKVNQ